MTSNFFDKDTWSESDWDIFLNNLEVLRKHNRLSKGELSKQIGVANIYRRDLNRPGKKTLSLICSKFNVTSNWFNIPHQNPPEGAKLPQGRTILTGHIETYEEGREHIGIPGKDSDRGSYGLPDLSGHKVTKVFVPDGTISANKYAEILEENRTIRIELDSYKERCAELEKIISSSKAPDKERRRHWMELLNILKGLPFQIQDRKAKYEPD